MKVLVFPKADKNPYQKLLYGAIEGAGLAQISYLENTRNNLLFLPFVLFKKYLQGYRVFHVHWPSFYVQETYPYARFISYALSMYCLISIRFSGLRLVWTVHNVIPHEAETSNDVRVASYLARHVSAKILHSQFTLQELERYNLDPARSHIVPHGNYVGAYPSNITLEQARVTLDLKPSDFVILFFGMVRPYKGVEELLSAYDQLSNKNCRMIIAGSVQEGNLKARLKQAESNGGVIVHDGFVKDVDVAIYFQASDVVCLPFKTVTTSGSALLAVSFDKPIIAPRTGSLSDFPDGSGFFYDSNVTYGLYDALHQAVRAKGTTIMKNKIAASHEYAKSLDWENIAQKTVGVYSQAVLVGRK